MRGSSQACLLLVAGAFLAIAADAVLAGTMEGRTTEAEAVGVAIGNPVADDDASAGNAVTRSSVGHYTWWNVSVSGLPSGDYTVHVRAKSLDGASHTFGEHVQVNGVETAAFDASVSSKAYRWYRLGTFSYGSGASLLIADWSGPQLAVDKVRIEISPSIEAEAVAIGTVFADLSARGGSAVTRTTVGIYAWWEVPATSLVPGEYGVWVRAKSLGGSHNFGEQVALSGQVVATFNQAISSSTYSWYPLGTFRVGAESVRLGDWSEPNLAVDALMLTKQTPVDATLALTELWNGNAQLGAAEPIIFNGDPAGQSLEDVARIALVKGPGTELYAYFRQKNLNPPTCTWGPYAFKIYMATSSDAGLTFSISPEAVIFPGMPGAVITSSYDPDVFRLSDGFYMFFEGYSDVCTGPCTAPSSFLAHSLDGLGNWEVRSATLCATTWHDDAKTPSFVPDPEGVQHRIQYVASYPPPESLTTRHEATLYPNILDPLPPSVLPQGQLPQSKSGFWDDRNFGSGNVLYENGYQYLFFEGANYWTCWNPSQWGIGLARNIATGGPAEWQKLPSNPLLWAGSNTSCWISYPEIIRLGSEYYLYYNDPLSFYPDQRKTIFRRRILISP